jgi:hypothetical protein
MVCLSVEQKREKFINVHSVANLSNTTPADKLTDAVLWQTELDILCSTHSLDDH